MLRELADGRSTVDVEASTLGAVLDEIGKRYPALERRLRDERGELRRYVNFFVDGEECRRLGGAETAVTKESEVVVIPSVAGG